MTDHNSQLIALLSDLDKGIPGGAPLYQQLVERFKEAIEDKRLMPGLMLPSTRELAEQLAMSRSTIVRCYEDLLSQRYVETIEGVGTFVRRTHTLTCSQAHQEWKLSKTAKRFLATPQEKQFAHDWPEMNFGCAPADHLPFKQWRSLLLKHAREFDAGSLDYGNEPFGYHPLRVALSEYLTRARAVRCTPEQVLVFPSSLYPLHLLCELLVDEDKDVLLTEPGFPYGRETIAGTGATINYLPCDDQGPIIDLSKVEQKPQIIYLTPSHLVPAAPIMSLARREMIVNFADKTGSVIIEDDYDSQFYQGSQALPSIQGLSPKDNVIYLGNLWNTLYPLINAGFMVIPTSLAPLFEHAWSVMYHSFHTSFPMLEQLTLTELLADGHFDRHVRKTSLAYLSRWRALVHNLEATLGQHISIGKIPSSTCVTVRFPISINEMFVREAAQEAELPLMTTAHYYSLGAPFGEFFIPFAHIPEDQIADKVKRFAAGIKGSIPVS